MIPLKITARMAEHVAGWDDGIHLDGILSFGAYRDLTAEQRLALPDITTPWAVDFDLPLERWTESVEGVRCHENLFIEPPMVDREGRSSGGVWGWKASAAHADWKVAGLHNVRKRPDVGRMVRYTNSPSVNLKGGQFKSQDLPYPTRFAAEIVWYALGDLAMVRRLLARVISIGKLSNHGLGRVLEWTVEPHWDHDAWTARVMPDMSSGVMASIRAPYHHPSRRIQCAVPVYRDLTPIVDSL
jgi:CRISPR type IV-associated protein Csf3